LFPLEPLVPLEPLIPIISHIKPDFLQNLPFALRPSALRRGTWELLAVASQDVIVLRCVLLPEDAKGDDCHYRMPGGQWVNQQKKRQRNTRFFLIFELWG
jgi:hypothetical protein